MTITAISFSSQPVSSGTSVTVNLNVVTNDATDKVSIALLNTSFTLIAFSPQLSLTPSFTASYTFDQINTPAMVNGDYFVRAFDGPGNIPFTTYSNQFTIGTVAPPVVVNNSTAGCALLGALLPPTYTGPISGAVVSGSATSFPLSATGTAPFAYGLTGTIPPGVSISGASLVYNGTAIPAGSYPFNIVTTSPGSPTVDTDAFTLTVTSSSTPPTYSGPAQINLPVNGATALQVQGSSPIQYTLTSAPAGITINAATGVITSSGTAPGIYSVTVTAINGAGTLTIPLSIEIGSSIVYKLARLNGKLVRISGKILRIRV